MNTYQADLEAAESAAWFDGIRRETERKVRHGGISEDQALNDALAEDCALRSRQRARRGYEEHA